MDCRRFVAVSLCLVGSSLGCVGNKAARLATDTVPPGAVIHHDTQAGTRQPKASTCVAYGKFREKEAMEPAIAAADKARMHDQARRAFAQALEIDPKYMPAYFGLAHLYEDLGDQERAIATYQKVVQLHPKQASGWFELAMCQSRHKEWPPAVVNLKTALTLDPENRQIATTYGYALARAGRFEESLALFTSLEGKAVACYKVARMAHHLNQDAVSEQYLQVALAEKPDLIAAQQLMNQLEPKPSAGPVVPASAVSRGDKTIPAKGSQVHPPGIPTESPRSESAEWL